MKKDKDNEKLDIPKLNEIIKVSRNILKIMFAFMIIGLILVTTYLIKEWKLLNFLGAVLSILSPFFIGIIIAWLLDPIVTWLQKNGFKRAIATVMVFLSFISLVVLFFVLLIPSFADQINEFIGSAPSVLNNIKNFGENLFDKLNNIYNYDFTNIKEQLYGGLSNIVSGLTVTLPNKVISIASSIVSGGLNIIFGLFIAFYMLFDFNNVRKHLFNLLPKSIHADAITLTDRLNKTLKSYVQGTLLIMLLLFIFQSITLAIAGLSSPMLFGMFCAVTNVIPYIGPYIGGIPAVIVGFTISPATGIFTLLAVVIAQFLESYFLNPIVMSKTMKLHPVTIMIGLLIFGHFFGILGMVLATPIISCIKIIFNFFNEKYEIVNMINNK
ncbi:MAG: AI-2E family transporter [Bacilli bacterium]|nr:AI-2E family transporter [Bacilli bacterium]